MSRRTIANVLAERLKQRYGQAISIQETRQKALKVLDPAVKDIRVLKETLREAIRVMDAIDTDLDALIGAMREDEEIAQDFMSKFAADTTLITNFNEGFVKNDPNLVAQVLEIVADDTLLQAYIRLDQDRRDLIRSLLK